MATVVLVVHPRQAHAGEQARKTAGWLAERGHAVVMPPEDAALLGMQDLGARPDDLAGPADLIVALGGDGTVLRAVRLATAAMPGAAGAAMTATAEPRAAAEPAAPVLGVNLGRLGYLAQVEPDELVSALERFLAGDYSVEERMMLEVDVRRGPVSAGTILALNDAVVEKPRPGSAVHLSTTIGPFPWATYLGDGLIVASPTGSTAYSFSARGPIVSPRLRALVVTPISPHMTVDRSLVVAGDEPVRVEVGDDRPAALTIDGRDHGVLRRGDAIVCRPSTRPAQFVTFGPRDFYGVLRAKLYEADR